MLSIYFANVQPTHLYFCRHSSRSHFSDIATLQMSSVTSLFPATCVFLATGENDQAMVAEVARLGGVVICNDFDLVFMSYLLKLPLGCCIRFSGSIFGPCFVTVNNRVETDSRFFAAKLMAKSALDKQLVSDCVFFSSFFSCRSCQSDTLQVPVRGHECLVRSVCSFARARLFFWCYNHMRWFCLFILFCAPRVFFSFVYVCAR